MTRAAFAPFHNGRALLFVENIGALPTWEIGRIVCREHGRGGCAECATLPVVKGEPLPLMRAVTQGDVEGLVGAVIDMVRAHGVTHLIVEEAVGKGPEAERQAWIAGELISAGCEARVELVPLPREGRSHDLSVRARALLAIAGGEMVPPKPKGDAPSRGPALDTVAKNLGADMAQEGGDDGGAHHSTERGRPHGSREDVGGVEGHHRAVQDEVGGANGDRGSVHHPAREREAHRDQLGIDREHVAPEGPRVAGIDPGSHWISVTVAAGAALPLTYVASTVIEVGRVEALTKPRTVTRKDGSTYQVTRRRIIEDADIAAALAEVIAFLVAHGVTRAAVERATFFRTNAEAGAAHARAAGLARAQWIGGEIAGALRAGAAAGVSEVVSASSKEWRAAACKAAGVKAWREAVRVVVAGLPVILNEHAVDGAGCAAWLVRPEPVKRARTPGERKAQSAEARAAAKARRDALKAEERKARGCPGPPACVGRRHADHCPIKIAANESRSRKMRGNTNAVGAHVQRGDVPIGRPRKADQPPSDTPR